jgi:hypothetical protein
MAGLDVLNRFLAYYKADKAKRDRKIAAESDGGSSMIAEEIEEPNIVNT